MSEPLSWGSHLQGVIPVVEHTYPCRIAHGIILARFQAIGDAAMPKAPPYAGMQMHLPAGHEPMSRFKKH